jgi:low temperature requirement protein LtrA
VSRHFRQRKDQEQRATWLELFFDLVFVFAVTQLSHYVVAHYTWLGALEALLLLLIVWWAWIYTTWMANWFDPDSVPVRLVLIVVMLLGLIMSAAIPTAFGDNGLLFACSYVGLQVTRNVFNVAVAEPGSQWQQSFARILAWSLLVAPLWILGGFLEHDARLGVWLLALGLDYLGPAVRYWTPRLGATATTEWSIEGAHFAERFQLFIIIALGESVVVTGATATDAGLGLAEVTALSVAFVTSAALWWLYFDRVAVNAQDRLTRSGERERLGRDAYTYLHIPIVAGIIISAVGDELMIDHPGEAAELAGALAIAGGPALYLLGHQAFRYRMIGSVSVARGIVIAGLAIAIPLGELMSTLALAAVVALLLCALVAWETRKRVTEDAPRESPDWAAEAA